MLAVKAGNNRLPKFSVSHYLNLSLSCRKGNSVLPKNTSVTILKCQNTSCDAVFLPPGLQHSHTIPSLWRGEDFAHEKLPHAPLSVWSPLWEHVWSSGQNSLATADVTYRALSLAVPDPSLTKLLALMDSQNNTFDVPVHACYWSPLATGRLLAFKAWLRLRPGSDNKNSTQQRCHSGTNHNIPADSWKSAN